MADRRAAATRHLLATPLMRREAGLAVRTKPAYRPAPAVGTRLRPVVGKLHLANAPAHAGLILHWPEIVGPDLAAVTEPGKLKEGRGLVNNGVLTIRVEGPVALELQHQEAQILERINAFMGYRAAGRLKLVQAPLENRRIPARNRSPAQSPPPAALAARSAEWVTAVRDEGLRASLTRLGAWILAQRGSTTQETN